MPVDRSSATADAEEIVLIKLEEVESTLIMLTTLSSVDADNRNVQCSDELSWRIFLVLCCGRSPPARPV